jgi:hypothetical protein
MGLTNKFSFYQIKNARSSCSVKWLSDNKSTVKILENVFDPKTQYCPR